jgi:hypothetical protein
MPAHHKLPVKNQTTKATIAAGINIKTSLTTKISITKPIPIRIMSAIMSRRLYPMKLKENSRFKISPKQRRFRCLITFFRRNFEKELMLFNDWNIQKGTSILVY